MTSTLTLLANVLVSLLSILGVTTEQTEVATVQIIDAVSIEAPTSQLAPTIAPITLCTTEDEIPTDGPCKWDNAIQGNGVGFDFIAYPDGTVRYTAAHYPACPFASPITTPNPVLTSSFDTACQYDGWVWTSPTFQKVEICEALGAC